MSRWSIPSVPIGRTSTLERTSVRRVGYRSWLTVCITGRSYYQGQYEDPLSSTYSMRFSLVRLLGGATRVIFNDWES